MVLLGQIKALVEESQKWLAMEPALKEAHLAKKHVFKNLSNEIQRSAVMAFRKELPRMLTCRMRIWRPQRNVYN